MNIYARAIAIVGVTGYAGRELERLVSAESRIRVTGSFDSLSFSHDALRRCQPDIVVLATEHDLSLQLVPKLLADGYRVLDMSGAYRLKNPSLYPEWYGLDHTSPALLAEAAYGLPEFF